MKQNKHLKLKEVEENVVNLKESPLYDFRKKNNYLPVIGEGDHNAGIMFIGEAPGRNEAELGRPFVGAAGRVLDGLLKVANLKRKNVYITNIVKDRPQNNRDPLPEEIELYAPFLDQQINIIQPKVLAALGRFSSAYIMKKFHLEDKIKPMAEMHGKKLKAHSEYGDVYIVPLYHPAAILYRRDKKGEAEKDFKKLASMINK